MTQFALSRYIEKVESDLDETIGSLNRQKPILIDLARHQEQLKHHIKQALATGLAAQRVNSSTIVVLGGTKRFYLRLDIWPSAESLKAAVHGPLRSIYDVWTSPSYAYAMTACMGGTLTIETATTTESLIGKTSGDFVELTPKGQHQLVNDEVFIAQPHECLLRMRAPSTTSITLSLLTLRQYGDQLQIAADSCRMLPPLSVLPSTRRSTVIDIAQLMGGHESVLKQLIDSSVCSKIERG